MHILHACPGIITISACVLRVRDYYFSGELASFPLPRPCIEKRQRSIISRQMFAEMLLWKFVRRSLQTFCRKYSNILDALFIQCGCAAIASAAQESPTRFSKKQKQEGKKKISKKAFTSRPMNSRNFSSRGLFVSIPCHLLHSRPSKLWGKELFLSIEIISKRRLIRRWLYLTFR